MKTSLNLRKISYYLPNKVQTNDQLKLIHPDWDVDKVQKKTGIFQRYIAAKDETSLDLGFFATKKLFKEYDVKPGEIDALLFVSQTPDYALPPSSCILQEKLNMNNDIHKMIYISIPKTGTNTVHKLRGYREFNHTKAKTILKKVGDENYFSRGAFCFIRNPFDLVKSWYAYHKKNN